MLPYILMIAYILASLGVAYLGRNTRAGWFGSLMFSILFTPLVSLITLIAFTRAPNRRGG